MSYPSVHPTNPSVPFNNRNDMERREGQSPVVGMATSVPVHSPPQHVVEPRRYHVLEQEQLQEQQPRYLFCYCIPPLKSFCGCIPLRTGIITMGILYLILALHCVALMMLPAVTFNQVSLCQDSPSLTDKTDFHSSSQNDFDHVSQQEQPPTIYMPKETTIRGAAQTSTLPTTTPSLSHPMGSLRRLVGSTLTNKTQMVTIPSSDIHFHHSLTNVDDANYCWNRNYGYLFCLFFACMLRAIFMLVGTQLPVTQCRITLLAVVCLLVKITAGAQLGIPLGTFVLFCIFGFSGSGDMQMFLIASFVFCMCGLFSLHIAHVLWSYIYHGKRLLLQRLPTPPQIQTEGSVADLQAIR
eukprot:GHVS01098213.1.p1 GENE.GHVS01098213.1~~GHVS01098213.1.p1  ORF type:complete len:353 (+),score=32.78 GHVS01098213.1:152-1210(+)